MSSEPTLVTEYGDPSALRVRIDTHQRYSEQRDDDPAAVVLDTLRLEGTESLVDVGCGDARFLRRLVERGHTGRLVGVDTSPAMVTAANVITAVEGVRASAEDLPFGDAMFDIVTAQFMLYHVPDPVIALREFARITRPAGRVSVVVNHPKTCARTRQLVVRHAQVLGLTPSAELTNTVDSNSLPQIMRTVFDDVEIRRCDNALIFDDPEPLIRFAESLFSFCGIATESPHRETIRTAIDAEARAWFASHPGQPWRDPKGYTVTTAVMTPRIWL